MTTPKTYIQQLYYDGSAYQAGTAVDILSAYKIVAKEFPFKEFVQSKDLPTRDWAGEDGVDVYVPDVIPLKEYDMEVEFLYFGEDGAMRGDLSTFLSFLYGRTKGADGDTVQSGRLAIYNEYVDVGRKDVIVKEVDDKVFYAPEYDDDQVAHFTVKFKVCDPATDVTPIYDENDEFVTLTIEQ